MGVRAGRERKGQEVRVQFRGEGGESSNNNQALLKKEEINLMLQVILVGVDTLLAKLTRKVEEKKKKKIEGRGRGEEDGGAGGGDHVWSR